MAELVRVRLDSGVEKNVGRDFADLHDLTVLDEPVHNDDGTLRGETRNGGRAAKKKTTVAEAAAAKQKEQDQ